MADYSDPEMYREEYVDMWISVLRITLEDYWRGVRQGQHRKHHAPRGSHADRRDAEHYALYSGAAHWLLSTDTRPRSFLWLMTCLRLDPADVYARMKHPPQHAVQWAACDTIEDDDE